MEENKNKPRSKEQVLVAKNWQGICTGQVSLTHSLTSKYWSTVCRVEVQSMPIVILKRAAVGSKFTGCPLICLCSFVSVLKMSVPICTRTANVVTTQHFILVDISTVLALDPQQCICVTLLDPTWLLVLHHLARFCYRQSTLVIINNIAATCTIVTISKGHGSHVHHIHHCMEMKEKPQPIISSGAILRARCRFHGSSLTRIHGTSLL
jgi:hypothetical protein